MQALQWRINAPNTMKSLNDIATLNANFRYNIFHERSLSNKEEINNGKERNVNNKLPRFINVSVKIHILYALNQSEIFSH